MKKSVTFAMAMASATAVVTGVLPPAASAAPAQDERVTDDEKAIDLSTPEAAKEYFAQLGISPERIELFANGLGLDTQGYYEAVARAFSDDVKRPAPIEFVDGKVKYNNTVASMKTVTFTKTQTRTQRGEPGKTAGQCVFGELVTDGTLGENVVSEVTEFDPKTCTRTVFDGAYVPAVAGGSSMAAAAAGPQFLPCGTLTGPPTLWQPNVQAVDGERRRYYKQSFVDPVCITITSSTLNVRWKNTPNSGTDVTLLPGTNASRFYYTALGENWPGDKKNVWLVPGTDETVIRPTEVTAFLGHIRTETDFPEHLALAASLFGSAPLLVALAACQFDLSDTTFVSNQTLKVRRNGGWWASGSGDVIGGCSSLVHERTWHGANSYAR